MNFIKFFRILLLTSLIITICSCNKDNIDKVKPTIDIDFEDAFPCNCDTLYFGETFNLKVLLKDNVALGSKGALSVDIHHNFDHHSHSTEMTECNFDSIKEPVNPFVMIEVFDLPSDISEYTTDIAINIPSSNDEALFDDGDYHLFISVTDKSGWTSQKGLSIKLLHR